MLVCLIIGCIIFGILFYISGSFLFAIWYSLAATGFLIVAWFVANALVNLATMHKNDKDK